MKVLTGGRGTDLIFHLNSSLHLGGTERQLVTLLRGLDRSRWRSRVVCFHNAGGFLDEARELDIVPVELPLPPSLAHPRIALVIASLASRLRREGAALLHCHDLYAVLVGVPAARLAGVPVIASRRDLGHHLSRAHRVGLYFALNAATRVLANAHTVADKVARDEGVARERITVVENGIDLGEFDRAARLEPGPIEGLPAGTPYVLTVGHLVHAAKGHEDLLRAIALLGDRALELRFVVAGGGPLLGELEALARTLRIEERVHFLWTRADVPSLLARAHLVVHPARQEGMPNAVLEAMAAGRPIVATRAGGAAELLCDGKEGTLVPVRDPAALADAIADLAARPEQRLRYGAAARRRIERDFSIKRLADRVGDLYEELLQAASPSTNRTKNSTHARSAR